MILMHLGVHILYNQIGPFIVLKMSYKWLSILSQKGLSKFATVVRLCLKLRDERECVYLSELIVKYNVGNAQMKRTSICKCQNNCETQNSNIKPLF